MSSIWERFDSIASKEEVDNAKSQFSPLPSGEYKAILESIEAGESKDGLPMMKAKLRIVENNRVVFHNQMLQNLNYPNMTAVNIAEAVAFLSKVTGEEIEFEGLGKLADKIQTITTGGEYLIKISYRSNDLDMKFPKVVILEAKSDAVPVDYSNIDDEDIPF